MNIKQFFRDYFTFTRNERRGIVILLIIIFVLAVANKMIFYFEKPAKLDEALLDSAKQQMEKNNDSLNFKLQKQAVKPVGAHPEDSTFRNFTEQSSKKETEFSPELFKFDPNKCSDNDFLKLGFSKKQVEVIRKYIAKGAVFRNADDFFKIRVISEKQKAILSPWIVISESVSHNGIEKKAGKFIPIEINTADSLSLEQLPGIGKVLSKRIIRYRDLLGGFYSIDQLKEVYGLSESTINQIAGNVTINKSEIHKIDLNFGDMADLSRHPYLKNNMARKIIRFRSKNGKINNPVILKDSMVLTNEEYDKIQPYF